MALRRQSSMSARLLSRRMARDGITPWLIISVRNSARRVLGKTLCSMSSSVSARTSSWRSGPSTPRTTCATRLRDGRVRIILSKMTRSRGATGPPCAHHTSVKMMPAPSAAAASRSHMRSGTAGDAAHALNATVSMSRVGPPAVASASRKFKASRRSVTASWR